MYARSQKRAASNREANAATAASVAHMQGGATVSLLLTKKRTSAANVMKEQIIDLANEPPAKKQKTILFQPSIEASMERAGERDIRDCNNASLSMAIADMIHCENLPERLVESARFRRVITLARTVSSSYRYVKLYFNCLIFILVQC